LHSRIFTWTNEMNEKKVEKWKIQPQKFSTLVCILLAFSYRLWLDDRKGDDKRVREKDRKGKDTVASEVELVIF
jgi:hypothetical protein